MWVASSALLYQACVGDPVSESVGVPDRITLSRSNIEMLVGDSALIEARVLDALGNALPVTIELNSLRPRVASAVDADVGDNSVSNDFWVHADGFGLATIQVTHELVSAEIRVETFPAAVEISGLEGDLPSRTTVQLTGTPVGLNGEPLSGPVVLWSTWNRTIATVDSNGVVRGRLAGETTIIARTEGGAFGELPVVVSRPLFTGSIAPTSVVPGQLVTVTLDPAETLCFPHVHAIAGVVHPLEIAQSCDSVTVLMPMPDQAGDASIDIDLPADNSYWSSSDTLDVLSNDPLDIWEPNDDPLTAPTIFDGTHMIGLVGPCVNGLPSDTASDCDDYFTVINPTDSSSFVSVSARWARDLDVDILWTVDDGSTPSGANDGLSGSLRSESASGTIPPQTTWRLRFNLYDNFFSPGDAILVTINGIP